MSGPERVRPIMTPWITTLRAVVAAVEASDVRELELRAGGLRIALQRTGPLSAPPPGAERDPLDDERYVALCAPLTGIWYDSPAPSAPPYVQPGDAVDVGTTVGLIETMKVFNEVAAEAAGIVHQVLVHRGELVTAAAPLILLDAETPIRGLEPTV